ncbi:hypothetical protein Tco_0539484 [Tanacetum coccineum]
MLGTILGNENSHIKKLLKDDALHKDEAKDEIVELTNQDLQKVRGKPIYYQGSHSFSNRITNPVVVVVVDVVVAAAAAGVAAGGAAVAAALI